MASSTLVNALRLVNSSTYSQTVWDAQGDGPFDLGLVYPLYSGDSSSTAAATLCGGSRINFHSGYYTFSGNGLPINVIYYGGGFSSSQQWLINHFLGNIGGTSYWQLVNAYSNWGWNGATPTLGSVWNTGLIWDGDYGLNGNDFANTTSKLS